MTRLAAVAVFALTVASAGIAVAAKVPATIAAALADPARSDQQGDDARRKAADVLALSGVKPGEQVVDYIPGTGYWTRILTKIVGPTGHVYAIFPAILGQKGTDAVTKIKGYSLANVTAEVQSTNMPTVPAPVDLFWTVQNYHDVANLNGEAGLVAFNKAVFAALKPGGIYVIIDHVAAPGSGLSATKTLHRIDPAIVKKEVLAAGFKLVGESTLLRNPQDDHTLLVFDPAIRGKTDQFIFKFRKP